MPAHQDRVRVRVLIHRRFQTARQILLVRGVFDNGHGERVVIAEHAGLGSAAGEAFDLFDLRYLEAGG